MHPQHGLEGDFCRHLDCAYSGDTRLSTMNGQIIRPFNSQYWLY